MIILMAILILFIEISINKGIKSKEMIGNDQINIALNKQDSTSQVKQISNELIQGSNCHANLTNQKHEETEQLQPIKIPKTGRELKYTEKLKIKPRN